MTDSDPKPQPNPERVFLDELRSKSVEAAADVMAGVQRLRVLHEDIAGEEASADRVRFGDYLFKLARLELEHAANILSLGNTQAEMLFEQVRRLAGKARGADGPRKVLLIEPGDSGDASGRVEVRNPFSLAADVRCVLSPFKKQDGELVSPVVPVTLDCPRLAPHSNGKIKLTVPHASLPTGSDVWFAELAVLVSAEIEQEVARRVVKLRGVTPGTP